MVFVLSQDDKARIPLGLPAANKQAPILMHLEYKIRLPDHDWVIAPKHKLIPSVYAALNFDSKQKLTYSGPTYIAIRSGKHDSSTAHSHAVDFRTIVDRQLMKEVCTLPNSSALKPIIILFSDGGPDENPRFPKTMMQAVDHFRRFDLDCFFISTNAAGYSAYNPVERRMAPLSRDLSGLILPHDAYGTHLDNQCRTFDKTLELKNFQKAGETLAAVWSENNIDGHEVFAEYILPNVEPLAVILQPTEEWKSVHLRQSHYLLQIVKCDDRKCCKEWRSQYLKIFPARFVPPPLLMHKSEAGFTLCSSSCKLDHRHSFQDLQTRILLEKIVPTIDEFPIMPFDYHCPTQQKDLKERMCRICFTSFATKTACLSHKKTHGKKSSPVNIPAIVDQSEDEEELNLVEGLPEEQEQNIIAEEPIHIIQDIHEWIRQPFENI